MGKIGGARPGAGRPPVARGPKIARATIVSRIKELLKRARQVNGGWDPEDCKKEAIRLCIQLLPYEEPRLQAVMSQTTFHAGDTLKQLLSEIDGTTTGIAIGEDEEPPVAAKQPLLLSN